MSVRRAARSLGLAITALLAACDSSTGPQPDVLLPLRVGNSWTYETSILVESGPYTPPPPGSFTMRVARFVRVGDEEWAEIEGASGIVFGVGGVAGLPRVLNQSDGLWMQQEAGSASTLPHLKWPYPATVGAEISGLRVDATDELVDVPAGSFRSVRYTAVSNGWVQSYLVAPRVGLVKVISEPFVIKDIFDPNSEDSTVRYVYTLKSFSLK
jgi:hypothetical protein